MKRIPAGSTVLKVVDILDFEASLVPELFDALRNRNHRVIFLVNKMDALPIYDSGEAL